MPLSFDLTLSYRGPLRSCNYGCSYCPFAKAVDTPRELAADAAAVERFVAWVRRSSSRRLGITFTPWGEALIRSHYRDAMIALSHVPHVRKVAAQTNLSCRLDWLEDAACERVGLWCTYHPSEVSRSDFVAQCRRLDALNVSYSVGIVGVRENLDEVEALRNALPPSVYVWVNAYKREPDYYDAGELGRLSAIDPYFPINNQYHHSLGERCRTGETALFVKGDGALSRCHFTSECIGNLYDPDWERALRPRPCPEASCGCHIGYVHLERLGLYDVFGDGLLERRVTDV